MLHDYQVDFAEHCKAGASSLGLVDVGLGKTVSVLTAIADMMAEDRAKGKYRRALVVGPLRVATEVWGAEAAAWEHTKHLRVKAAVGSPTARMRAIMDPNIDIVTINYDNLAWLFEQFPEQRPPFYFLVFDEVDKMKDPSTQRFKAIRHRAADFPVRIGMTGTLIPESVLNVWGPVFLVCSERAVVETTFGPRKRLSGPLGSAFNEFKRTFFEQDFLGYKHTPRPGAVDAIMDAIAPYVFQARAGEHLDLPDCVFADVRFDLPKKARKQYDALEKDFVVALEQDPDTWEGLQGAEDYEEDAEGTVYAPHAAVLKNKLRQICSGFVYVGEGDQRKAVWLHKAKLDAYKSLLSELMGAQAMAVYGYKAEYERFGLKNRLGGGVSATKERKVLKAWNAGELQVLGMHPASAGHGLNLQTSGARHIAFLTLPWSAGLFHQTVGRLRRQGQKNTVVVHRFIARGTVEEDVVAALEHKASVQEAVLEAIKHRVKRRA